MPRNKNLLSGIGRHPLVGLAFLLFFQVFFIHTWPTWHPANESSRFYFLESVVRDGSLSVDESLQRYGISNKDLSVREGRHYMDKAPGLAFAAVPVYKALDVLGVTSTLNWPALWPLITFLCVTLPSLFGTVLLYRLSKDLSGRRDAALVVSALYAIATPALAYSTLFFGHQFAAVILLSGFTVLQPGRQGPISLRRAVAAGFLLSYAVVSEYQLIVVAAGLALYGFMKASTARRRLGLVAAGLVPAIGLLVYHAAAFGHPLAFPYAFKNDPGLSAMHAQGLFGFVMPTMERVGGLLIGPQRGLLYGSPFLLLFPLGALRMFEVPSWKGARWAVLWAGLSQIAIMTGYGYWTGGDCVGPRFLVPVLPFLVLPLAALWRPVSGEKKEIAMRTIREGVLPGLGIVALLHQVLPHVTFPYHPEALSHPFFDISLPFALRGCTSPSPSGLEGYQAIIVYGLVMFLGALWLYWATQRNGRERSMVKVFLAVVAFICVVGVFLVQLIDAPPPDRLRAVGPRAGVESLMDCGDIRIKQPPPTDTRVPSD